MPEMKRESETFASVAAAQGEILAHQFLGELYFNKSNLNIKKNPKGSWDQTTHHWQ